LIRDTDLVHVIKALVEGYFLASELVASMESGNGIENQIMRVIASLSRQ
tara:strand:- start:514 stop:660 length:147 start_codon:yes stop_codon:yes gene_type:complete